MCWNRDAFRDAALLVSVFAVAKVLMCSTCVDPRVWNRSAERRDSIRGEQSSPSACGPHFFEQLVVMATDEQPMTLHEFLETRGSRKTGANSKTSTATKLHRGELASLLAEWP